MEDCKTLPGIGCQICWAKLCWGHGGRGAGLFISPSGTWCEHCEHESHLIMKHHEVLETFGNRCRTTALQTEQYGAIIMHSYAHRNKAKQMNINLVNTTYTCTTGVTTRHKVCTLPENTVPSTSLRFHRLMATITSKFTLDHPLPLSLSFLVRNCLYGLPDQSPNVWERNGNTSKSPNVHKSSWKLNWPKYQNDSAFQGSKLCDTDMLTLSQETSWCTHLQVHSAKLLLSPS